MLIRFQKDAPTSSDVHVDSILAGKKKKKKKLTTEEEVTTLPVAKFISVRDGKYCVISHQTGKSFGCYSTRSQAQARLDHVHSFAKHEFNPGPIGVCLECTQSRNVH